MLLYGGDLIACRHCLRSQRNVNMLMGGERAAPPGAITGLLPW